VEGWNEDNSAFYLVTNKGEVDLSTLFLMDMETLTLQEIESDPNNQVDFGGLMVDRNTRKTIATSYTLHQTIHYWKDLV
ncbi:MAG TPA: hypothetical protein PLY70_19915, partial [Saprospiraceae bacterium]|nr:hypothetical protein [Saprospiraceae bacterium]